MPSDNVACWERFHLIAFCGILVVCSTILFLRITVLSFSYRLLEAVDAFEHKLIDSSLLSNSTSAFSLETPLFAVAASVACPMSDNPFPGKSSSFSEALPLSSESATNLSSLLGKSTSSAVLNLPKNFADSSGENFTNNVTSCPQPLAVVFHVIKNGKLFQSASADSSNLQLPDNQLSLGDELRVINSLVVSASLTYGLNTSHLKRNMNFLVQERVNLVSVLLEFLIFMMKIIMLVLRVTLVWFFTKFCRLESMTGIYALRTASGKSWIPLFNQR